MDKESIFKTEGEVREIIKAMVSLHGYTDTAVELGVSENLVRGIVAGTTAIGPKTARGLGFERKLLRIFTPAQKNLEKRA
jgi:hypothetical protein